MSICVILSARTSVTRTYLIRAVLCILARTEEHEVDELDAELLPQFSKDVEELPRSHDDLFSHVEICLVLDPHLQSLS